MEQRFRDIIGRICPVESILLAVSGGIDSMCMLRLAEKTLPAGSFSVAHCNFRLRGEESDGDENLVRSWCSARNIRLFATSFDTIGFSKEHKASIEMGARELRYRWFASLCDEYGFGAVAVAHNADDNGETLILNLVRGTGIRGICGMRERAPLPYPSSDGRPAVVVRPMLNFSREEICAYVAREKVSYREDRTNSDTAYKRNSIRHEIAPVLRRMNPSYLSTFSREMRHFREVEEIADLWFEERRKELMPSEGHISIDALRNVGFRGYALFRLLEPYGFNESQIENILTLISDSEGTMSGKRFTAGNNLLLFTSSEMLINPPMDESVSLRVEGPGEYCAGSRKILVSVSEWKEGMPVKQPDGVLAFDAAAVPFPFVLRSWRDGDRMRPLGMRGSRKLSDIFTDMKLSIAEKQTALVIEGTAPLAFIGLRTDGANGFSRIDESVKITPSTVKIVRIEIS